jgi:iron complex outermembrane receptor protein
VQFFSADPENKMGARLDQTMGSSSTGRTYVRLDTGLLESNTKAYFSYADQSAQKWKGSGVQKQEQFNSKLVHIWGENKLSAFVNTSDRTEVDYQDMSIDMQQKLGWGWDNYAPNWKAAIDAANGTLAPNVASINPGTGPLDAAYYQGSGLRKDRLAGTAVDLALTDDVRFKSTFYSHTNKGQGHWYTPYTASPGSYQPYVDPITGVANPNTPVWHAGLPISIRTTEYSIDRKGWVNDLTWNAGIHTVNAGLWTEKAYSTLARNFYAATGPTDTNYFLSNPFRTDFVQTYETTTTQVHLQDTLALMDGRLKVNAGFKSPKVQIDTTNQNGTRAGGKLTAQKSVLPQLGIKFALSDMSDIFASASQNMRAYQPGVSGPFSQTQSAYDINTPNLKPETSTSYEAGYRFKGDSVQGSVAAYMTDFRDRLMNAATCQGIVGCASTFVNVGKVQSKGVEAALIWSVAQNWNWFNSVTLNDSKYQSDYLNADSKNVVYTVHTNGKTVVDAPKLMFSTDIGYEKNGWYGSLNGKYTGERYYTYLNDNKVDAYFVMNASAGYREKNVAGLKEASIQLAVTNLMDKKYFSTIGSNGFVESDPKGAYATMLEGAPRQVFLTLSGKF